MTEKIYLKAPATSANLGPGFDVFGLALSQPFDTVVAELIEKGIIIESEGYSIPVEPAKNCAGYVALKMFEDFQLRGGIKFKIKKCIKPARGLGSSAASAASASFAINKLFNLDLSTKDVIKYASYGEIVSAGSPHLDNVVACILGGFTITISYNPLEVIKLDPPENISVVIALPNIEKGSTKIAREAVPKTVLKEQMIYNIGRASAIAAGFSSKNINLIKIGMDDCIVEPARSKAGILKEFEKFKELGKNFGAGISASGAGPSVIGIIEKDKEDQLGDAMKNIFESSGYECQIIISSVGEGLQELKSES